jgi:hypothetical protein
MTGIFERVHQNTVRRCNEVGDRHFEQLLWIRKSIKYLASQNNSVFMLILFTIQ